MCVCVFALCCISQRVYSINSFVAAVAITILQPASAYVYYALSSLDKNLTMHKIKNIFSILLYPCKCVLSRAHTHKHRMTELSVTATKLQIEIMPKVFVGDVTVVVVVCLLCLLTFVCLMSEWCTMYVMALEIYRFSRCVQYIWIIQK